MQKTGVDLQKDVYAVVAAIYGSFESENPEALGIVNMKYDEGKLLAVFREKGVFTAEETYGGRTLYTLKNEDAAKDMRLAFLNKANIVIGSPLR